MKKLWMILAALLLTAHGGRAVILQDATLDNMPPTSVQGLSFTEETTQAPDPTVAMSAPVNALVMAMMEHDLTYDLQNTEFYWNALYYMVAMYEIQDFRVTDQGDTLLVPEEMLADCAYALFGDASALPTVPETMADFVAYIPEENSYALAKGDCGLAECSVMTARDLGNGVLNLSCDFLYLPEDAVLAQVEVTILEGEGMFGYHIQNVALTLPVG